MSVIDMLRLSHSRSYCCFYNSPAVSFLRGGVGEKDDRFMYQNTLIELVNAVSFAWVAANSSEETPQAFWKARARFIPASVLYLDSEPPVQWIIYRWARTLAKQDAIDRAGVLGPKASVSVDFPRCFLSKLHSGSPVKEYKSPNVYRSAWKCHRKKWNYVVSQKDDKNSDKSLGLELTFPQVPLVTTEASFHRSALSIVHFEICLV